MVLVGINFHAKEELALLSELIIRKVELNVNKSFNVDDSVFIGGYSVNEFFCLCKSSQYVILPLPFWVKRCSIADRTGIW